MKHNPRPSHLWTRRDIDRKAGNLTDRVLRMENEPLWRDYDQTIDGAPADPSLVFQAKQGCVWSAPLPANTPEPPDMPEDRLFAKVFDVSRRCRGCGLNFRPTYTRTVFCRRCWPTYSAGGENP